jgi:hypothetical protein
MLPLAALTGTLRLTAADLAGYDGFHLILADAAAVSVYTWDGATVRQVELAPGDHIIVNDGVDTDVDPLIPHFRPLLAATPSFDGSWAAWQDLLRGDTLAGDDPRALIMRREFDNRSYGSSSASLIGISADADVRFAFTATPEQPSWYDVAVPAGN